MNETIPQTHTKQNRTDTLTLMATNVQCITNKVHTVQITTEREKADIVCVSEHWMTADNENLYNLRGFQKVSCFCRRRSVHGGVCIYISEKKKARDLEFVSESSLETQCELQQSSRNRINQDFSRI